MGFSTNLPNPSPNRDPSPLGLTPQELWSRLVLAWSRLAVADQEKVAQLAVKLEQPYSLANQVEIDTAALELLLRTYGQGGTSGSSH